MSESEWLSTSEPQEMLEFLRGKSSSRIFRLFAIDCCRHIWPRLNPSCRSAVDVAQRYSEGLTADPERREAARMVNEQCIYVDDASPAVDRVSGFAAEAVLCTLFGNDDCQWIPTFPTACAIAAATAAIEVIQADCEIRGMREEDCRAAVFNEQRQQCEAIRQLFGNPFSDSPPAH